MNSANCSLVPFAQVIRTTIHIATGATTVDMHQERPIPWNVWNLLVGNQNCIGRPQLLETTPVKVVVEILNLFEKVFGECQCQERPF